MSEQFMSKARWPDHSGISDIFGNPESIDYHDTYEQAESVLHLLRQDGYGGERKIFPVWVKIIPPEPK